MPKLYHGFSSGCVFKLVKKALTDHHRVTATEYLPLRNVNQNWKYKLLLRLNKTLRKKGLAVCVEQKYTLEERNEGKDWPANFETMIGMKRLNNLEFYLTETIKNNIPGDVIETGV